MPKIKINPEFNFDKYGIGLGIVVNRENESKKFIRDNKEIRYLFAIMFLWFTIGLVIEIEYGNNNRRY